MTNFANLTDAQIIEYGEALAEVEPTTAWQLVLELFDSIDDHISRTGLTDDTHPREWWLGQLNGMRALKGSLLSLPKTAAELKNQMGKKLEFVVPSRKGGGELA